MSWTVINDGWGEQRRKEFLIGSTDDIENLPAADPGSIAYTADMVNMYMYDGTTWVKIGGEG